MTDDFCKVTRKKWMFRTSLQKRNRRHSERSYDDFPEVDIDKFMKRLEKLRDSMSTCDYFVDAIKILEDALKETKLDPFNKIDSIICFGIGPFTRTYQALHQLIFILCLQKHFKIQEATYYDPVFRESEKEILNLLKCKVMDENCEAKYEALSPTLFYMPHCPHSLTNNLLWSNWTRENLQNVFIINNSFETLVQSRPDRFLKKDSAFILNALQYVREFPLEDDYELSNVFNDLSLHVFPKDSIPLESDAFWQKGDPPVYEDNDMIAALPVENLSLS